MNIRILKENGFTLIELLVVISIISLLSSVVLASVNTARERGKIAAAQLFDRHTYSAFGAEASAIWNFDETSGNIAYDSSGNGNDLSIGGTVTHSLTDNVKGNSLNFDGVVGSVLTSTTFTKIDKLRGSISMWVYPREYSSTPTLLNFTSCSHRISILNPTVMIQLNISTPQLTSINSVNLYKWNHVVVSWDATISPKKVSIYINGSPSGEAVYTESSVPCGRDVKIGGDGSGVQGTYRLFNGKLDEYRIYTQSLQTAQVKQLYAQGLPTHTLAEK